MRHSRLVQDPSRTLKNPRALRPGAFPLHPACAHAVVFQVARRPLTRLCLSVRTCSTLGDPRDVLRKHDHRERHTLPTARREDRLQDVERRLLPVEVKLWWAAGN